MESVISFVVGHYRLIISLLTMTISIVFFIIRKKPVKVVDSFFDYINNFLPIIINQAEATGLKGKDKRDFVVNETLEFISKLGCIDVSIYRVYIESQIEAILSTPQKHS